MAATVWKGYISFGMVSIPVRLYSGARGKTISFHLLHKKDNSRVHEVMYCDTEDKPVTQPTESVMDILQFVKGDEIGPVFFESSYYVGADANGQKPYALLFEAMRQSSYDGLAKVTMHGREHIVILRRAKRGIMLHTMYYVDEIRDVPE